MNVKKSLEWIQILYQQGVREFCLCPGGRNAPLVKSLNLVKDIRIYFFYDERSAGFFALGCSKRSGRPTAVVTTSGTAAANLLPATIEAYYSGIPLVLLTADRPKSYRSSGAPQSIEQIGLFSHYVGKTIDYEVHASAVDTDTEDLDSVLLAIDKPTHINLCFDEPLLSDWGQIEQKYSTGFEMSNRSKANIKENSDSEFLTCKSYQDFNFEASNQNESFGSQSLRPLVLLGPGQMPASIESILIDWRLPIYAEAGSSLREAPSLAHLILRGGTQAFPTMESFSKVNAVIRIGQVPTCRLWRDLERDLKTWPVLSFSDLPFSGLARSEESAMPYSYLEKIQVTSGWKPEEVERLVGESRTHQSILDGKLLRQPYGEEAWFRKLSEWIPKGSQVFLGNSLPIRHWDVAATLQPRNLTIQCNRGANGIDGLISTALGWSKTDRSKTDRSKTDQPRNDQSRNDQSSSDQVDIDQPIFNQATFAIIGDLSCLYDMNAFQVLKQLNPHFHLVVINNGGGKIFSAMFGDKNFENRHSHSFRSLAEMFEIDYHLVDKELPAKLDSSTSLIEIVPC